MTSRGLPLRTALLVGVFTLPAVADPNAAAPLAIPDNAAIDALILREADETITLWRQNMGAIGKAEAAYSRARSQRRLRNTGVRSPALDRAGAASAIELASAAIRTSLEGTEAGVSVAPAALLGAADSPHQPTLSLASLKDDKTRFAAAYNYQCGGDFQTPTELMLKACTLGMKDEQKLRRQIQQLSFAYKEVCKAVHAVLVKPWRPFTLDALVVTEAVALCPGVDERPKIVVTFDVAGERLVTFFEHAKASVYPHFGNLLADIIGPVQAHLDQLEAFKDP
ncbi:MAG TPA: hypothetical protein VHP33_00885, partial [Polyangiaceae bacterium]|nr:hypothetical protein [Polyangiaceae bacterium]